MGKTRQQESQYREEKSRWGKFFAIFIIFILVFAAGVWFGQSEYFPKAKETAARGMRKAIETPKTILEGATAFASKEELTGAIESSKELEPNEKRDLKVKIEKAYEAHDNYDGPERVPFDRLWGEARKEYEEGRKDGNLTGAELRAVVKKLDEAACLVD